MTSTIEITRRLIGRRYKIGKDEMVAILDALAADGLNLANGYVPGTTAGWDDETRDYRPSSDAAAAWAEVCDGITIVCADSRGLPDGAVRYDQPGSMHPEQHAELIFAAAGLSDDTVGYLLRRCDRLLIVE